MKLHILGIGGTFMSALAILAREAGFTVTGSDSQVYSPVRELLLDKGISWTEGYVDDTQACRADVVIVGNAVKRGMPVMEAVMEARIPYISGPQWLAENILSQYRVLAVSGTHGKTTLTSMLTHILTTAHYNPGFLIGGVDSNLQTSAKLGHGEWFIIEADEYDSAFFDKRPKFMHYRPEIAILNNLEFDHADIYKNLADIQQQFHYFLKTIPPNGTAIKPEHDVALNEVIKRGYFSHLTSFGLQATADWQARLLKDSGESFEVWHQGKRVAEVNWSVLGQHNVENALAAIAASAQIGISPQQSAEALALFAPVKRRLEVKAMINGVTIYDDFAHHPTAIAKTIQALKNSQRHARILVAIEFASFTMRHGVHAELLGPSLKEADKVYALNPQDFDLRVLAKTWTVDHQIFPKTDAIIDALAQESKEGDAILVMSNRHFDDIHQRLPKRLSSSS